MSFSSRKRNAHGKTCESPVFSPAFSGGRLVHCFSAPRTTLLAAAGLFVHRRPSTSLRLLFRRAAVFIAFFDVLSLAFLLARICRFISPGHNRILSLSLSLNV